MAFSRIVPFALLASLLGFAPGCTNAVESGRSTALDSVDLTTMTDRMAASLSGNAAVNAAMAAEGPLKVVVQPVENRMTGEVLPAGEAEAFIARVRFLLAERSPERFTWVMNRDAFYRLRGTELEGKLGPAPEAVNPRYCLWAKFYSLTRETSASRSAGYLCVFELTDLDRRTVLWTDRYEVKKVAVKGFLD